MGHFASYYKSKLSYVPFVPTDIVGCQIWLKSDAGITKDGSNYVSQWADQSGNNNHATQANGSYQPLWFDNQLNNKPSVLFDAINDYMTFPNISLTSGNYSVFAVHKLLSANVISYLLGGFSCGFYGNTTGGFGSYGQFDGSNLRGSSDAHNTSFALFEHFNNKLYRNGIISSGYVYASNVTYNMTLSRISARPDAGYLMFNGYISEIIIYNSTLSDTDRQLVENYINTKYAIW